jgi:hypothetical protein
LRQNSDRSIFAAKVKGRPFGRLTTSQETLVAIALSFIKGNGDVLQLSFSTEKNAKHAL